MTTEIKVFEYEIAKEYGIKDATVYMKVEMPSDFFGYRHLRKSRIESILTDAAAQIKEIMVDTAVENTKELENSMSEPMEL